MSLRISMLALCGCLLLSCGKSEQLSDDEREYVDLAVALGKIKARAKDSADHARLRDSVYRAFGTTQNAFTARTESMTADPDRTSLIFRAINDSLKIK